MAKGEKREGKVKEVHNLNLNFIRKVVPYRT